MGARVLFRDSHGRDGQVDLNPTAPLYVGRALDCAVRTDDAMVSRKHSMIRMENGRFFVEDLGSSNGTHVNDVRVTKHPLSHNDVVRCGSLWLRYVEDGPVLGSLPAAPPTERPKPKGGTQRLDVGELGLPAGSFPGGQGSMMATGPGLGGATNPGQGAGRGPAFARPGVGPGMGPGGMPGPGMGPGGMPGPG